MTQDLGALLRWAYEEFTRISQTLEELGAGQIDSVDVVPLKPRNGMVRHTPATNWNPGSGAGYYGYNEGTTSWKFLG
jgi:hypothetical protein